jgi:hypothetical protein
MRENLDSLISAARLRLAEPPSPLMLHLAIERGLNEDFIHTAREASVRRLAELPESGGWFAFEDAEVLPPAVFDPRVFDQDVLWIDALRRVWRIEGGHENSLTNAHLLNLLDWLPSADLDGLDGRPVNSTRIVAVLRSEATTRGLL